MRARRWMDHRQAYYPRLWPVLLVGAVVYVPLTLWLVPRLNPHHGLVAGIEGASLGVTVGCALTLLRLRIWRHRNPVLTPEQYARVMARQAHLN